MVAGPDHGGQAEERRAMGEALREAVKPDPDLEARLVEAARGVEAQVTERVVQRTCATVYRMQAAAMYAQASQLAAGADGLEAAARRVEAGEDHPPQPGQAMKLVVEGVTGEVEKDAPPLIEAIQVERGMFRAVDGGSLPPAMVTAIGSFAERYMDSPMFAQAVNEHVGQPIDHGTLQGIAARVAELEAERTRATTAANGAGEVPEWNGQDDATVVRCPVADCDFTTPASAMLDHISTTHPDKTAEGAPVPEATT